MPRIVAGIGFAPKPIDSGTYPDGLRLLATDEKNELSALFALSGEKRKLATGVFGSALSPEGSEIAFFRDHAAHELRTMPAIGRGAKARFAISKDENFLRSAWSLDGKTIAPQLPGTKVPARNPLT